MSTTPRPHGQVTPAPAQVNSLIRRLMDQPASRQRTTEYHRLLEAWAASGDREPSVA